MAIKLKSVCVRACMRMYVRACERVYVSFQYMVSAEVILKVLCNVSSSYHLLYSFHSNSSVLSSHASVKTPSKATLAGC